jgi:glycosyltransferase involved in cell wall biosynthesis
MVTNDGAPDEVMDGVPIRACRLNYPRWRVLIDAKRQFLPELISANADIYQLHSPELLPLALPLKRAGKLVVYDAHEDLPRHILEKDWVPWIFRRPMGVIAKQYLRYIFCRIDEVISPLSHVVAHLQCTIGKGILVANFPIVKPAPGVTEEEFAQRPLAICYAGTVYKYSNQEAILEALSLLPEMHYQVAGHIAEEHRRTLEQKPGESQIRFLGRISQDELRILLNSSICGMCVYDYKQNLGWKLGSYGTNKLFEYMEAGLPIICTDYDLWRDLVERWNCGVCVQPGSVEEIRAAIEFIMRDKKRAYRMGQNGRRAVLEEFNWATEERKYLGVFERLTRTQDIV